ncbi:MULTISPECIES: MurR/RpiR family transcriptional regulator [Aminobacterium]|uniref:MurR/RpiR family transcriptional regulator n=1 Tax=Aminobacterium TaxID=81466 RepID=UPI00257E61B7|nr:MurR/RpiR family transcriptional regulator [Aminobacterium sp. UBA4987]
MKRIKMAYPKSKGTQEKLIRFILDYPDVAAFLAIGDLAEKIGISTSSISRASVDMGYSGFPEMQKEIQQHLRRRILPTERMERAVTKDGNFTFRDSVRNDIENVKKTLSRIPDTLFNDAVTLLSKANEVFVVGLGTQYPSAMYFSGVMKQIRDRVTLISHETTEYFDCFSRISSKDVLLPICLPRYSRFTVHAAQEAEKTGCKIIAITDSEISPTGILADIVLQVEYESMSFFNSNVAVMAVLNALATSVAMEDWEHARERVGKFSEIALNWNAFYQENSGESMGERL